MTENDAFTVTTVDYHTAGEPFRIVTGGVPPLRGRTVLDRRSYAAEHLDRYRRLLVNEPRGHADMYGCFVTEPDDRDADLGVVFFHNAGYSTACGHGTIALVTWALESGTVGGEGADHRVVVDAPSGRLEALARLEGDRVAAVRFRNVPAFVQDRALKVDTSEGPALVDLAYGGAYYASLAAVDVGLSLESASLPTLIRLGREIQGDLNRRGVAAHPAEDRLSGVYGVIFFADVEAPEAAVHQRNVTVFADGEVDRSPCGSGTSARLAILHQAETLATGEWMIHESVVGTRFRARVVEETRAHGRPAVVTEVEGSAYRTGEHRFVLDPRDPIGTGFLLR